MNPHCSLKLTLVQVFTSRKLASTTTRPFIPQPWLLTIYQHTTVPTHMHTQAPKQTSSIFLNIPLLYVSAQHVKENLVMHQNIVLYASFIITALSQDMCACLPCVVSKISLQDITVLRFLALSFKELHIMRGSATEVCCSLLYFSSALENIVGAEPEDLTISQVLEPRIIYTG